MNLEWKDLVQEQFKATSHVIREMNTKIISICQNKGGVGKTTSAINLGYLFSKIGKVLLIDLDSQANLSQSFGIFADKDDSSVKDFIDNPDPKIIQNVKKNIDILPNNPLFEAWKKNSNHKANLNYLLGIALKSVKDNYDYILIDCPPSLDLSFDLALYASDYVLILSDGHKFAMMGMDNILLEVAKSNKNNITDKKDIQVLGLAFNMYKKHTIINNVIDTAKELYDVFNTKIRDSVAVPESQAQGLSVIEYDINSNASQDYIELFNEILGKING